MSWQSFVESLTSDVKPFDRRLRGMKVAFFGFVISLGGLVLFLFNKPDVV